jgi:hypothetical protein
MTRKIALRIREHFTKLPTLTRNIDHLRCIVESNLPRRAEINPLEIYQVNPHNIKLSYSKEPERNSILMSPVFSGSWDRNVEKLENYEIITSINYHFNRNRSWEHTQFYSKAQRLIESDEEWPGRGNFANMKEFETYLDRIDSLYSKIKSEGFKTQGKLFKQGYKSRIYLPAAIGLDEVTVSVDRHGDFIHEDGWHRLAISRALDLKNIPVRIKIRHEEWQRKRQRSLEIGRSVVDGHPDIEMLLNQE